MFALVVITGAGRAFCAGGDLALIGKGRQSGNVAASTGASRGDANRAENAHDAAAGDRPRSMAPLLGRE